MSNGGGVSGLRQTLKEIDEMPLAEFIELSRYDAVEPVSAAYANDVIIAGLKQLIAVANGARRPRFTSFLTFVPPPPVNLKYIEDGLRGLGFKEKTPQ